MPKHYDRCGLWTYQDTGLCTGQTVFLHELKLGNTPVICSSTIGGRTNQKLTVLNDKCCGRIENMKIFSNNKELFEYLLFLASELKKRKFDELSEAVTFASRHAAGNMSTEFLGESRIALRRVLKENGGILTVQECADLSDVLKQLTEALDKR